MCVWERRVEILYNKSVQRAAFWTRLRRVAGIRAYKSFSGGGGVGKCCCRRPAKEVHVAMVVDQVFRHIAPQRSDHRNRGLRGERGLGGSWRHSGRTLAQKRAIGDTAGALVRRSCERGAAHRGRACGALTRHGQSAWNKAQSQGDVHGMARCTDHPLSEKGLEQCEALRRRVEAPASVARLLFGGVARIFGGRLRLGASRFPRRPPASDRASWPLRV